MKNITNRFSFILKPSTIQNGGEIQDTEGNIIAISQK